MKKNHPVRRGTILSLVFWVLLGAILLGACGSQPEPSLDFYALERQTYESENGYSIQFPADWVLLEEDLESTTFVSGDGSLSCTISCELGGVEYYSLEEIGDMLLESLATVVLASSEAGEPVVDEATYRNQLTGETVEGDPLTADVNVYRVQAGVRYYMTFLTDGAYEEQQPMINAILGSFRTTMHEEDLYQLMKDRREEAADETSSPTDAPVDPSESSTENATEESPEAPIE